MDVYGNIKDINYIELPSDWRRTMFHFNIHNSNPIQYGCTFFREIELPNDWLESDVLHFMLFWTSICSLCIMIPCCFMMKQQDIITGCGQI